VKSFGRIDRFAIREVVPPALMGLLVYTFLLMMRPIFSLVEMVLVRGVTWGDAFAVLGNTIPHVLVLTVPMSFLFGVLIAVGRMNSDNEIIALQAAGIPSSRLLRPIVLVGVLLATINGWMYLFVIPDSNRSLREMRVEIFANAKNIGRIEAGVFYEEFPNLLLYVREVAERGGRWRGVMIFDTTDPVEQRLTLARHGGIVTTGDAASPTALGGLERWILLEDVVNHQFNRAEPEAYRYSESYQQVVRPGGGLNNRGVSRYQLNMRERRTASLIEFLRSGSFDGFSDEDVETELDKALLQRRLATIELNRRVAIPFACVVFALLAVPLGVGSRSGGRGRGFIVSIGVILAYYVMNNNGEILAVEGRIPAWLGMWIANFILLVLSAFLITRMGRWMGERQRPEGPIARWLRHRKAQRRSRARAGRSIEDREILADGLPVALERGRVSTGFPTILDRYVIRRLLAPLAMVLVSTSMLYVVIDLTDNVDDMAKNSVPFEVIVGYYFNLIPQLIMDIMPLAMMISVLILLTVLERQQELTAFKAGGISLYRVVVPILLIASLAVGAMWVLSENVVPDSNRNAKRLLDRIKGRDDAPRLYTSGGRQWLLSRDDRSFYSFLQFDEDNQSMVRFTKLTIDESMELRFHLFAQRVTFKNGSWMAESGWYRTIQPDGTVEFEVINRPIEVGIPEAPEYFAYERRLPAEMSVKDLRAHIDELVDSGHQPARLIVRWHQKFAYPLSAFLMVFLALPYGLNRGGRRVTTMQGVALALVLGIIYYVSVAFFGKLGEAEVLPPVIGAWSPAILATLFAINRLTTLRT
jgi:LPS export ABC transporter permease LptG/LPS export ABC transporter permease LptF